MFVIASDTCSKLVEAIVEAIRRELVDGSGGCAARMCRPQLRASDNDGGAVINKATAISYSYCVGVLAGWPTDWSMETNATEDGGRCPDGPYSIRRRWPRPSHTWSLIAPAGPYHSSTVPGPQCRMPDRTKVIMTVQRSIKGWPVQPNSEPDRR